MKVTQLIVEDPNWEHGVKKFGDCEITKNNELSVLLGKPVINVKSEFSGNYSIPSDRVVSINKGDGVGV